MSKEDQIILRSHANLRPDLKLFFQDAIALYSLHQIILNSLNRLLPWFGAQELTIKGGGTVKTMFFTGHLWPQAISCSHWPLWPTIHLGDTPFLGLGGFVSLPGASGPSSNQQAPGPYPFNYGVNG
ncbi:hypothetical protein O181_068857 [Austropuccinia psidii MF-1]|uniref:Uncharacterized protein n=1 Tax=Austropuccinia psidii MF-1 TaxID=1389203 RepID=A0A9Q3F381_9BASI|nr:hypothetical protein [Austropuccinia psidii MF-1]